MAEGEVVLRVLMTRSRFPIESMLVSARQAGARASLLSALQGPVPVYVASQVVLDRVLGFHLHRGLLAVGRREGDVPAETLLQGLGPRALVLGLVGISNHDNIGGIFRNAAAFGADAVLLDGGCCDPLYRKAIRVSVGASLMVPFARVTDAAGLIHVLRQAAVEPIGLSPRGAERLGSLARAGRAGLILGAEGPGLPDEVLGQVRTVRIAMAGEFDSLNVATASGIALHYLTS